MKPRNIKALPVKTDGKEIGQGVFDLGIERDTEINGAMNRPLTPDQLASRWMCSAETIRSL